MTEKTTRTRLVPLVAGLMASTLVLGGCGFTGVYGVPLPGGAQVGDHPFHVTVRFADVLDLVPQANVKVNDVPVGRVEKIDVAADGWSAEVTLLVNGDVRLPANTNANLVQSSLLGEKFVELARPVKGEVGRLSDGSVVPLQATNRNPEVEELLGALSMLLNSGGVDQLQTVAQEVNKALTGNEPQIKELLANLDKLVGTLDGQRDNITAAIDGVNRLASTLVSRRDNIDTTLTDLEPGLRVLSNQRTQLVEMLRSLDTLSGVAVDTVNKSRDDIVADLKSLTPTLTKLAEAGQSIPQALHVLLTVPFSQNATSTIRGDYTNLDVKLDANLDSVLQNLGTSAYPPVNVLGLNKQAGTGGPALPLPVTPAPQLGPALKGVDGLLGTLLGGGR
jgi:phospholipid/cholesterol/gamma-HCH transport system substrate-binding protein